MAESPIPITTGSGSASVASDLVSGNNYQQIKLVDGTLGSLTPLKVNADGSITASVYGTVTTSATQGTSVSGTVGASIIGTVPVTFAAVANQSVSGTVGASVIGITPTNIVSFGGNQVDVSTSFTDGLSNGLFGLDTQSFPWVYNGTNWEKQRGNSSIGALVSTGASSVITIVNGLQGASVSGSVGIVGTPSISGSVNIGNAPSIYGNISGSVAAFLAGSTNASVITVGTVVANQSVSGTVGASIVGGAPIFLAGNGLTGAGVDNAIQLSFPISLGSGITNPFGTAGYVFDRSGGSIWSRWTGNSSIGALVSTASSSVITVAQGSIAATIVNTSVNVSGSVVGFQAGTRITSVVSSTPSSMLAGASIFGQLPAGTAVLGSVAALQGTNPWIITGSVQATVNTGNSSVQLLVGSAVIGSVATLQGTNPWIITGSVQGAFSPSGNQSVSGTVGASVIGIAPVTLTANTIPATSSILVGVTANTNGSVLTTTGYPQAVVQITSGPGASITGQVNFEGTLDGTQFVPIQGYNIATGAIASAAGVESDWAFNVAGLQGMRGRVSNWSVGSITAIAKVSPSDARAMSHLIVGTPAVTPNFSSIIAIASGSIVALSQGSIITVNQSSSVLAVPVGSVITVFQAPSIVGTYAEDAPAASGDKGFLVMGARNDTLSSVTSADGDYSSHVVGPAGELIAANAPFTKWVSGTASMLGGTPVTGSLVPIIAAQGASVFTYITGLQIANASGTNAWITLLGATNSVVGYTVAPANGGSNIYYQNGLKTNANAAFSASISAVSSVYVSAQGFIAKI